MLYIAISILGATVMPHNLYLHSSIVQTRKYRDTFEGKKEAIRFSTIDSSVALMSALFINAAILVMAAATFHGTAHEDVADIADAYQLLSPLLGTTLASTLFAVALLCSGQNATLTGTLAGQIVMEGFINLRLRPWLRRLITRLIAIVPADDRGVDVRRKRHGTADHPEPGRPQPAAVVRGLSARDVHERRAQDGRCSPSLLLLKTRSPGSWRSSSRCSTPIFCGRLSRAEHVYKHILVAVEHSAADRTILTHVAALAKMTGAELLLVHVADGWAARNFDQLQLRESEEMKADRAHSSTVLSEGRAGRLRVPQVRVELANGGIRRRSLSAPPKNSRSISSRCPRTAIDFCPTSSTAPPPTASAIS